MSTHAENEHLSDDSHELSHVASPKVLITTFVTLLILTGVTVAVARIDVAREHLENLALVVALAIAVVKATVVMLYFMHLKYDKRFNALIIVSSLVFIGAFIGFAMWDSFEYQQDVRDYRIHEKKQVLPSHEPLSGR